jgi:hypothetical protein
MKLKKLFLGMLGAAMFIGCNNETSIDPNINEGSDEIEGVSTHATFELKLAKGTYAGGADEAGKGTESDINDAALVIYKLDGTPEAIGYLTATDFAHADVAKKFTLKCYSGDKLIYLAVNIGGDKLLTTGLTASNATQPGFLGLDWTDPANSASKKTFADLNVPIWATATVGTLAKQTSTATTPDPSTGAYVPVGTIADDLIKALTNDGNPAGGSLGAGTSSAGATGTAGYLMSNWGDASTQPSDDAVTGTDYVSTAKFTLKPSISASDSRLASASPTNAGKNGLLINIQRAVAKLSVNAIDQTTVGDKAGQSTNKGKFIPDAKWAAGNINRSVFPIQQFDGNVVRSTRYRDTAAIKPVVGTNQNWENKLDNGRWIPTSSSYFTQNLQVGTVRTQINTTYAANAAFGPNRVYLTENNNRETYNAYSTFIVFAGQYQPNAYITKVDLSRVVSYGGSGPAPITGAVPETAAGFTGFPAAWVAGAGSVATTPSGDASVDTLYFVQSFADSGLFFLGFKALQQYVAWVVLLSPTTQDPTVTTSPNYAATLNYINGLRETSAGTQADLQAYYRAYCFYRVWIRDGDATSAASKILVRRNHIYQVNISSIKGPGIGDPNDIIDPHPEEPDPIEEAETYVTATINIMNWHIINQDTEVSL